MFRKLRVCLLFLFFVQFASAQILPFRRYTVRDGLNTKTITSVIRDDRGLLWVGTPFGINWFDGSKFYQPSPPRKVSQLFVQRFFKDRQGTVWTLTFYNGFYKFRDNRFTQFLIDTNYSIINRNNVMDMTQVDASHYVVATDGGAFLFDGKNFQSIDKQNLVGQIATVDYSNGYLLAGSSGGLYSYKLDKSWTLQARSLNGISINRILFNNGNLWVATDKGLYFFEHFDFTKPNQPATIYLNNVQVIDVTSDQSGDIWFNGNGITYKLVGKQLIEYPWSTGLSVPSDRIYFDQQNTGWFATRDGLYKLGEEYYSFQKREPYGIISFTKADGKIWMSYRGGFSDISGKYSYHFPDEAKTIFTNVYYAPISKTFWVTNEDGMFVFANNKVQKEYSLHCSFIYEDKGGVTWIATSDGKLFTLSAGKLQPIRFNCFQEDFISSIVKDQYGFIWLGFRTGGVLRCKLQNNELKTVSEFSSKTGFQDLRIRSCYPDGKGNILFGTRSNGLFIFSPDAKNFWHINSSKGLNATWVSSINGTDSTIYLGTNNGVYILNTQSDYSQSQITAVNFANEEVSKEIDFVFPVDDEVFIGANGVIRFFPGKFKKDTTPPPVFITHVSVEGKADTSWTPYSTQQQSLSLAHDKNVIAFEFAGIHLKDEDALHYRYKLEGQDADWSAPTDRNFVSYNLPPGHYTFKVQAQSAAGVWSNKIASYSFVIAQPFWSTWWFISLIIAAAFVIAYFIYRYRLQQAVKLERLRYKISTDLHDDIGSTLSSISILSEMALSESNRQQNEAMVTEIKENSLNIMEKMDDIVWSINPKNDSLGSLLLRIKRFSSNLFEARDIDYVIDIDKAVSEVRLPMEYRQHIYLILKEAINNLVKYSGASKASVEVNFSNAVLKIRISDNGKGFDMSSAHLGNGIISMRTRAALMKANLQIESVEHEGTTVRFSVKIK